MSPSDATNTPLLFAYFGNLLSKTGSGHAAIEHTELVKTASESSTIITCP